MIRSLGRRSLLRLATAPRRSAVARSRDPQARGLGTARPRVGDRRLQRRRATSGRARARARRRRRPGRGTSLRPSSRATISCDLPLSAPPSPATASFTSLGLYCTTGMRSRPAIASASPLACPTDIAVRAFTWNSTRSTAIADRSQSRRQRVELGGERGEAVRERIGGGVRITPQAVAVKTRAVASTPRRSRSGTRRDRCRGRPAIEHGFDATCAMLARAWMPLGAIHDHRSRRRRTRFRAVRRGRQSAAAHRPSSPTGRSSSSSTRRR